MEWGLRTGKKTKKKQGREGAEGSEVEEMERKIGQLKRQRNKTR